MLRIVNWAGRTLGLVWLGVVSFVLAPPSNTLALAVQLAGYFLVWLALGAWALIDFRPGWASYRDRLFPLTLGVIGAASGLTSGVGSGGSIMIVFAFVAAAVAGGEISLTTACAVTGASILAIEVSGLAAGASVGVLLGFPPIVVAGLIIGRNRAAYRIQAEQSALLLAQRDQLESEQRRADLLDERTRIAREIHDVLAHSLGALGIQIQAVRAVLSDSQDLDRADEMLAKAQRMAADGLVETRRAVHALRAETLPLDQELARVSDSHAQRYHVAASFGAGGMPHQLPPEASIALLRVAQESLVNAAKHAAGQAIAVRLEYGDADVRLTVCNDLGPDSLASIPAGVDTVNGGYGLTGMRERLKLLNGTLEAGRRDNQWIVSAEVPRSQPEDLGP
jgi:signal transduction histidine kinase